MEVYQEQLTGRNKQLYRSYVEGVRLKYKDNF